MESIGRNPKRIDEYNIRVAQLNAEIERSDLIAVPLEHEVYSFVKSAFGIYSLRETVTSASRLLMSSAQQKSDHDEKKRDEKMQAGLGLIGVFAVFSALVDAIDFLAKLSIG